MNKYWVSQQVCRKDERVVHISSSSSTASVCIYIVFRLGELLRNVGGNVGALLISRLVASEQASADALCTLRADKVPWKIVIWKFFRQDARSSCLKWHMHARLSLSFFAATTCSNKIFFFYFFFTMKKLSLLFTPRSWVKNSINECST